MALRGDGTVPELAAHFGFKEAENSLWFSPSGEIAFAESRLSVK
jgi:hypothetical protein